MEYFFAWVYHSSTLPTVSTFWQLWINRLQSLSIFRFLCGHRFSIPSDIYQDVITIFMYAWFDFVFKIWPLFCRGSVVFCIPAATNECFYRSSLWDPRFSVFWWFAEISGVSRCRLHLRFPVDLWSEAFSCAYLTICAVAGESVRVFCSLLVGVEEFSGWECGSVEECDASVLS